MKNMWQNLNNWLILTILVKDTRVLILSFFQIYCKFEVIQKVGKINYMLKNIFLNINESISGNHFNIYSNYCADVLWVYFKYSALQTLYKIPFLNHLMLRNLSGIMLNDHCYYYSLFTDGKTWVCNCKFFIQDFID